MIKTNEQILNELKEYNAHPHTGIKCGLRNLDNIMRLDRQRFCICTSNENQGKTTFINYYCYMMAKTNGYKTLFLSFENGECLFYNKLQTLWSNNDFVNYSRYLPHDEISSLDDMFAMFDYYLKEWGFDILVLDPFESLQELMNGNYKSEDYGRILEQIRQYTQRNNIITILSAHQKKMLNEDDEPTISNIFGSVSFGNKADFIFSIKQEIPLITKIKTLKIRNNFAEGKKGKEIYFSFNPRNQRFYEIDKEKIKDFRFEEIALQRETREQETTLKDHETKGIDNDTPTEETTRENARESDNLAFLQNTKVSMYGIVEPFKYDGDISLIDAIDWGKNHEDIKKKIEELRLIDRTKNENEYRAKKRKLPSFTCCGTFANKRDIEQMTSYANMAIIDIDHLQDVEKAKKEISCLPFVLYCGKSAGGKGVFCIIRVDGTKEDYPLHLNALIDEFKAIDYEIDTSCKEITRLRFCSLDDEPIFNKNAIVYTKRKDPPTPSHLPTMANEPIKNLSKHDLITIENITKDIQERHLQLTKDHSDTLYLGNVLYSLMGENGRQFLHTFRAQRRGYDSYKLNELFDYVSTNEHTYISNPMGALLTKYREAVNNQFYN